MCLAYDPIRPAFRPEVVQIDDLLSLVVKDPISKRVLSLIGVVDIPLMSILPEFPDRLLMKDLAIS